jgi:hypothetical protein
MVWHLPGGQPKLLAHPLSYVRQEQGWTYQDLVDVIARRVGNSAARREKAWRWEHWSVAPDNASQLALAAELGVPVELVHSLGWPAWLPVGERINVDLPWTVDGSLEALDGTAGAALLDRRGFLILGRALQSPLLTSGSTSIRPTSRQSCAAADWTPDSSGASSSGCLPFAECRTP